MPLPTPLRPPPASFAPPGAPPRLVALYRLALLLLFVPTGLTERMQLALIDATGGKYPVRVDRVGPPVLLLLAMIVALPHLLPPPDTRAALRRFVYVFTGGAILLASQALLPRYWLLPLAAATVVAYPRRWPALVAAYLAAVFLTPTRHFGTPMYAAHVALLLAALDVVTLFARRA